MVTSVDGKKRQDEIAAKFIPLRVSSAKITKHNYSVQTPPPHVIPFGSKPS